jgi:iron complex transport system permease protein
MNISFTLSASPGSRLKHLVRDASTLKKACRMLLSRHGGTGVAGGLAAALSASLLVGSTDRPARALAALLVKAISWRAPSRAAPPRALSSFAVGSLLAGRRAVAALFRNPLADPYVMGVSGGSAGALGGMLLRGAVGTVVCTAGTADRHHRAVAERARRAAQAAAHRRDGQRRGADQRHTTIADSAQLRGMVFWLAGDLGCKRSDLTCC